MDTGFCELDVIALTADIPAEGLVRGQVGTIVEQLNDDAFEVEFSDDQGRTYAQLPVHAEQMMRLYHHRVDAA